MKYATIIAFLLLFSCSNKKESSGFSKTDIIGTWENISLTVKMKTYQNRDTTSYLQVPEGKWEEVLKIKHIRTTYTEDGKYKSVYRDLDDKVVGESEGVWTIRNDSLALETEGVEYTYSVILDNGKARFVSLMDWDQDGEEDDLYDGWQRKVEQ